MSTLRSEEVLTDNYSKLSEIVNAHILMTNGGTQLKLKTSTDDDKYVR